MGRDEEIKHNLARVITPKDSRESGFVESGHQPEPQPTNKLSLIWL
jgi:hypothetical protein